MARPPRPTRPSAELKVYLDLLLRDRVLLFVLENCGDEPATDVRVKFRRKIFGLGGDREISSLPIWSRLAFMPPGKVIEVPIDRAEVFFAKQGIKPVTVSISYTDGAGRSVNGRITHDFEAWRGLPEIGARS